MFLWAFLLLNAVRKSRRFSNVW